MVERGDKRPLICCVSGGENGKVSGGGVSGGGVSGGENGKV